MSIINRLRLRLRLFALAFLCLALLAGCGGASTVSGVAAAVDTTLRVVKEARAVLCTTALDPLMGDPRAGQPIYTRVPAPVNPPAPVVDAAVVADGSVE